MLLKALVLFLSIGVFTLSLQQASDCNSNKNQYFDEIKGQCRKCPGGSPRYNAQAKMCECCSNNMVWDWQFKKCVCPRDKPINNYKLHFCLACPQGLEYDQIQNQCYHCPQGFKRGPGHTCDPMYEQKS